VSKKLPEGCFEFIDHKCITRKDINHDRPYDQCDVWRSVRGFGPSGRKGIGLF